MAAHSCCGDDAARAAARARRRVVKLRRRPSSSNSLKASKLLRQQAGGKRPGARRSPLTSSRKKSLAIRRKMASLRRFVSPAVVCRGGDGSDGGERLDELLLHAAGYIVRLQMQVRVMQVMVRALNNPDDY